MTHDGKDVNVSRRGVVRGAALLAGGSALAAAGLTGPAFARSKLAQSAVSYQDKPKGRARCDNCTQWEAPSSCKLVEGAISPSGWCTLYAPNPKAM